MSTSDPIQLIVGLGNPGLEYTLTRHNVGTWYVEAIAQRHDIKFKHEKKFHGKIGKVKIADRALWLLIPTTYMNDSGYAIKAFTQYHKIPINAVLVAHDDLDFMPGIVRLKAGGGHGGHNGLRDTIAHLGNGDFIRLRIGIGHPGEKKRVHNYVLSSPSKHDRKLMIDAINLGTEILPALIKGDLQKAFRDLHGE